MKKQTVMVAGGERQARQLIISNLSHSDRYRCTEAASGEACLLKLRQQEHDAVLIAQSLPGLSALETIGQITAQWPHLPILVLADSDNFTDAVSLMKAGAADCLFHPAADDLLQAVSTVLEQSPHIKGYGHDIGSTQAPPQFEGIIGESGVMQDLFRAVDKISLSDVTVLIQGESGTGKERFARAIHQRSPGRQHKPFVAVNCTALPESLLETELFGHEKGAFTGATAQRIGRFELADGGTVFLDEIGDMSLAMQAKILRVLQEREFERVGGNRLVKVNIRLISATHKDLRTEVAAGRFREDLFYRLSVFPLQLPALRERRSDIIILAHFFLSRFTEREHLAYKGFAPDTLQALLRYDWPGNVRELENAVEHSVVVGTPPLIVPADLPSHIQLGRSSDLSHTDPLNIDEESLPQYLERLELSVIKRTLLEFEGNVSRTARKLGIGRATVYRKAQKHKLPISR